MNELQIFNHVDFGQIRCVEIDGKPYAVGVDVARALEYSNPSKAVIQHCKGITKLGIPSHGGIQETNVIPEGDIYRLIIKAADQSKNPEIKAKAEKFERWIFDEVIPSIRKHGAYITPQKFTCIEDVLIQSLQEMKEVKYQIAAIKQESKEVKEEVQAIKDIIVINPKEEWRKQTNNILNQIGFKTKEYKKVKDEAYKALEDRAKCKLKIRLENLQGRALREGMAPSKVSQLNNLDVIANDVRLKEIYINIVKEMAIKHGIQA